MADFTDDFSAYGVHLYRIVAVPEPASLALLTGTASLLFRRPRRGAFRA